MTESKENLKKRIDTNKNQYIENNEVDNFAKDKKNGDIDLNNLGEYLNNLPLYNNDELKKALNKFFRSPERNKYDQTIKNKVTNNQPLDKTELSLMYLAMIAEPNKHLTQQQLKFDSNKPIDQICDGALIRFIRTKYNFPTYTGKKVKIDLPNETKKKTNSTIDKIQESKRGDTKLPENIGEIKESEANFYCDRLITRAEKNFANDIEKAKRELEQKHRYKNEEEKKAYIKRDTLLIAFSKYTEAINSQHEKHISNSGYKDKTDFENQMKLIEEFGKEIERKYPNINNILEKIKKFDEEMKANEKKYFKNENETKKAEKNYKEFNEYMDKKSKEYNIDKIQESLKKEPKTKEEMEEYLQTMNKIFEFQEDLNKKNKTYGGSISKYQNYIKGAIDIQKKYNIQEYQEILENYNQDISNWNKKIDFKKYENYKNGLDWKLEVGLKNINTLQGIITDPDKNKNILVKEFKDVEDKQQIKQNGIDRIRERIKKFSPGVYWTLTTFTGLWNGLIDATIGVSTSLGVMILGIIGGTDETLSQMDRKARRDNFFKIGQSSSQKESVYDSETGFNFHADNTVSTVASSISQMLTLIYGGGAIGSGASKVLGISENIAGRVGLFTSSFITQVGGSYQEAITHGLTGKNAIGYSFLSATIQSSLELVSPNDVLLGKGNGITKELIRNACNEGGKQSFMLIGKTFLKNVGLEIIEENIQEGLQTAAGNLINMVVNGTYGSKLGADWSWKNFASTAIITTLTTGITTGVSTGVQMYEMSNQDQTKLIEHIKSDNGLYLEVTGMLDKAIEGKISIPNISIEQLQNLKLSLTGNSNINTPSTNTNIQTDYEIKSSPEIEQISQILGSRFHEERRQSRLQSDGTYAPRVEKTSDQTWISKHNGQTEVDIANTPFEDLPSDWKSENLEAAKVAVGLIYDMVKNGEKVTSEMIEKMAEIVHNKRLERNGTEGSFENQRVPYKQLTEEEKAKDRNQLLQAIETIEGLNKHEEVQNFIIEKLKKEKCVEPIGGVNTIISYEDLSKQLIESALKNGLPNVAESIKNGNYEDPKIYELPKYQELLSKGFILPSDIRPYYKTKTGEQEYHLGIDYQVEVGKKVRAIYDGEVVESGYDGGLGNRIIIRHNTKEDGTGYNFYSLYGHLGKDELIPKGKLVEKGQKIGKVGNPKENGGWPSHLHFQIMERQDSPRGHLAVEGKGNYDVLTCFGKNEGIQNSGDNDNSDGKSLQSEITENEINETNKKTNVERLEELGIKIPEDSKESVNKIELNFEIIGNQNINNISPSDFEKLVDSHVEFSKSLITPELINKLLDTKNVGESRILIEKFSKNNDADLFNSILKKREEKIMKNINSGNGFISKYEQLVTDIENFEYNGNNIDEFRKILERHNNKITKGFKEYLIGLFPNKSDIEETMAYLKSTELSDIIIDYHFNDISYNIFLDIKELLNFQVSNGITIPIEHLKIYKDILDIDMLPTKEKIKLHKELKNKKVIEMFYNDYSSCRDRMYQEIADSILDKEKLEQFKDNELSEQHGISVYKFNGQEFFALERESGVGLGEGVGLGNTDITKGFSFSLVGKDCIGTRYSKNFGKPVNSFIYEGLNPQAIMHVFPKDSHTNSQYQPRRNDNNRHNFGQIVNTLMSPTELLKATQEYNEIFVLRNGNNGNQYQSIGEIKPIALYCYDEITPKDIETAKSENVGIMLIKTNAYKKNAVVPEWGVDFTYGDHTYIDGKNGLDNAIENRGIITTFEKDEELNDILNNTENNIDYFDGKSHKIFKGDTTKAELNSKTSDRILSEIDEQNRSQKLEELRKEITEQYKQSTGEELQLSDEQLLSIIDAHEQDGILGELTIGQLRQKVKTLDETITDPKLRRFLLEAGFCRKIEIISDIQNNIPSLLNKNKKSSINFEFSKNNPELHKSFIKTGIIAKLTNYTDITIKKGGNPELLEILEQVQEELENLPYEERLKTITNINSYLESAKKANNFINLVKRGGTTAKELFLKAKGENTNRIADFEGEITVKQYRNSIVFEFEKSSDVIRFFKNNGNGLHFASNIAGLDTIMINKENCKNAGKIGLGFEDAMNRTIFHESQHTINKFFMSKTTDITYKEAIDPKKTDIETFKQYALDRAKDEIIAQYTNRLIIKNLSTKTISILSKGSGIKELLTTEGNTYDYFKKRRNTPEEKKAREEHIEKVKNLIDCIDETFKTLSKSGFNSDTNIQNILNLFSNTDITEWGNIQNIIKSKFQKENPDYFDGKSNSEGLIFDSKYVTQKDAGIYRFNTKETTNTQKNKPGYQSLQEAEQSLNDQIGGKYDKKLYQESFTKKHQNEDFEEDVDDFIKYATEKELNHKQIFLDLAKEASAKALFIGGPKKKDRIIEKVRNELLKEGEGLEALTDFTRATILFDNFSDFEEGLKVLEKMKNEGRILDLKIRNRLTRPGCNDIFVNIQTPDGYVSEVQFHIPEVLVFRDEKLGDLSINRYKSDNNILDKHTLTKDIFDLSNDKYKRNLEAYNKIIDRLNEGRDKDHLLSLPKEQDQIVYDHDMYDIIRVLEVYENADNLTLEDYELFTSKGFKHENIKDLLNDLRLMKEHLCNEALNRYRTRTKQ